MAYALHQRGRLNNPLFERLLIRRAGAIHRAIASIERVSL
jgi:hypothetical protein